MSSIKNGSSIIAITRRPQVDFTKPSVLVTFKVGAKSNSKEFSIHKEVICFMSPVFAAYFTHGALSIDLPQYEPAIFGLFAHWLYTQEIKLSNPGPTETKKDILATHLFPLTRLWTLAQQCEMPELENKVMDRISLVLDSINMIDVSAFIIHVYNDVDTDDTAIRALARYHATHNLTPEILKSLAKSAPRSLLFDMAMSLAEQNDLYHNSDRYELVDSAKFHVGIPEVDEELLDDELSAVECLEPEYEELFENNLEEHFKDEGVDIADEIMEMQEPCGEDFEKAEGNEIEEEDIILESPMDKMIDRDGAVVEVEYDNFGLSSEDLLGLFD